MQRLEIKLLLRLLRYRLEIGTQSGFCNSFSVIVAVLLALVERLHINRGNDPGLEPYLAQRSADKVRAQANATAKERQGGRLYLTGLS